MKNHLLFLLLFLYMKAFAQPPVITNVAPLSAPVGTVLTLTGSGFNTTASKNIVFFGAVAAAAASSSATTLSVTVPTGASYGTIGVLNTDNSLSGSSTQYFNPTFTPDKGSIIAGDFTPKTDFTTGNLPASVAIGDLDGDGKLDLAVVNLGSSFGANSTVSIFRNTSSSGSIGSGSFSAKVDFTVGWDPSKVAIGDLDGDGKPDLIVANYSNNTVSVLRNTSSPGSITTGSFAAKVDFITGLQLYDVAIGDLDGDGKPDLAAVSYFDKTVSVFRNTSSPGSITSGSFAAKVDFAMGSGFPTSVTIGDLDGDGKQDLVVTNGGASPNHTVSVFRNISSPGSITSDSFAAKVDFATRISPRNVAIGDLDGDGKPDLAVVNTGGSNTVSVFQNISSPGSITTGSFAARVDFSMGTDNNPYGVAIGDLDGDGRPDLAIANFEGNAVTVFRNTSSPGSINTGSFAAKVDFATGILPVSIAIGDIDGDGKPDLAVANYGSDTVSVLRNDPQYLSVSGSQTNVLCNGESTGSATVTATGGTGSYTYVWDTTPVQTGASATGLSAGTYTVTVTDEYGTKKTLSFTITEGAVIAAPTGEATQSFNAGDNLSVLLVTGENIKWYTSSDDAANHINDLPISTLIVNDTTYYATQTVGICESKFSLPVRAYNPDLNVNESKAGTPVLLYPNPVKEILNFSGQDRISKIVIVSPDGRKVMEKYLNGERKLDVRSLPEGVYLIQIFTEKGVQTIKFIKNNP